MNYFERDAMALVKAAQEDPHAVFRIIIMALLSIRQPWNKVAEQFDDVMLKGYDSKYLFGFKREGYKMAHRNMMQIHGTVKNATSLDQLIVDLMKVPGLGLAKASFVAQMTVGDGACLDSHNLRRIGLDESFTRLDKSRPPEILCKKVDTYNEAWKAHGDSAYWWNSWCEGLAARPHSGFSTADEVSAAHRLPLLQQDFLP